ncbi:MAG: polymer-forming cytoskeletal protein [Alphaproteobacteria bacterium]|nr:polymer-forming cytoskeletal protein [Alphaproteobacteria bacterium]
MNTMNENKSTQQDVNSAQEVQAATAPANSYQRSNQAPVQSYAPSYSPASSYSTSNASESAATVGDRRLTIGAGITMSGEIESCDYLLVEGTVEAALKGASMLEISESGTFYGTVEIGEAVISGRFEGDITVTGRLLVRAGGVITGAIAYGQLEIEAGAIIDGRLTPVVTSQQTEQQQQASSSVSATSAKKVPASHDAPPEPANTEGNELFSKTAS